MRVIFANGSEATPLVVTGGHRSVQGATRDVLTFVFPESASLDEVDAQFSPEACEQMTLVDDNGEYIYHAYTIRVELKRTPVVVSRATGDEPEVIENRVMVAMGQRTYAETQLASLMETVDMLVMESLMG